MAKTDDAAAKQAGRPPIDDHLTLYLFVEVARRNSGTTLRRLAANRKFKFAGWPGLPIHEPCEARDPLSGEALRRRFSQARVKIGLDHLPSWVRESPAHDEVRRLTEEALERIVAGLIE